MSSPRALLVLLPFTAACSYFPSHEEVFIPVPLSIGEARVVDGDTSWVLAADAYEIVAPRQELLPEARRALDEAAEQFRAVFGVAPARVMVALHEPDADRDAGATLPAAGSGEEVVAVRVPPAERARRGAIARPRPIPLAPVARAWLGAYVDARSKTPRLRTAWAPGAVPAEDPRLPDWLEDGIVGVVAGSPFRDVALARLAEQPGRALPLRELTTMARPAGALDPVAGRDDARSAAFGAELEGAFLFATQSYGVARFLADREGRAFLGGMVDRVVSGDAALAALDRARHLPADLEELQREWERWLDEEFTS